MQTFPRTKWQSASGTWHGQSSRNAPSSSPGSTFMLFPSLCMDFNNNIGQQNQVKHALHHHMQLCASVNKNINQNLADLDRPVPGLEGDMLWSLILKLPHPGNPSTRHSLQWRNRLGEMTGLHCCPAQSMRKS